MSKIDDSDFDFDFDSTLDSYEDNEIPNCLKNQAVKICSKKKTKKILKAKLLY